MIGSFAPADNTEVAVGGDIDSLASRGAGRGRKQGEVCTWAVVEGDKHWGVV